MFSVMIVDDEPIILKGITDLVMWSSLKCEVTASRSNGFEALQQYRQHPTDIVVTDIRMPGLDGLELSKKLLSLNPSVKIIILSGYADFHYAQQALRLGVSDFLIKDNPLEKISESVRRTVEQLEAQQSAHHDIVQKDIELRNKFYSDIINGIPFPREQYQQKSSSLPLISQPYYLVVFKLSLQSDDAGYNAEQATNFYAALSKLIDSQFGASAHALFAINSRIICLIIYDASARHQLESFLRSFCDQLFHMTNSLTNIRLCVALSGLHQDVSELEAAFLESYVCLNKLTIGEFGIFTQKLSSEHAQLHTAIRSAMEYMQNHLSRDLSLAEIAGFVNLNPSYFSRIFKKESGQSVMEYLSACRIEKAKTLLISNPDEKLINIAVATGFNDATYFSTTFKKYVGTSPSEFRIASACRTERNLPVQIILFSIFLRYIIILMHCIWLIYCFR